MATRLLLRHHDVLNNFKRRGPRLYSQGSVESPIVRSGSGIRPSVAIASTLVLSVAGYALGSFYPPEFATLIQARPAPPPPHPSSPEGLARAAELEKELQSLPFLKAMREAPDASEWYETRPYVRFPPEKRVHSMTAGALSGPGKLGIPPLVRAKRDERESIIVMHVGRSLCGHDGIVHGGLLATVLDEAMGRVALLNFPTSVGVTANLSVNYRAPTKADQFLVVRVSLKEMQGRKSWTTAKIETLDGTLLADASALFIEPKYAKLLSKSGVREALGAPDKLPITADVPGAGGRL